MHRGGHFCKAGIVLKNFDDPCGFIGLFENFRQEPSLSVVDLPGLGAIAVVAMVVAVVTTDITALAQYVIA